jgi:hypothetical protein
MPMAPCPECGVIFPPNNEGLQMMLEHFHLKHQYEFFIIMDENGSRVFSWNVEDEDWTEYNIEYDKNGRPVFTRANVVGEEDEPEVKYYCMTCGVQHNQLACPKCGSKMKRVGT